ncbi:MAG: ABC transporter substrate-binding protein [Phycisphaera sp.]|nr:MAG: ABC transporter substrate-binding protein [Phycisphaera sp.]
MTHPSHLPKAPRVISLLPSATEILCLVGGDHLLVGRSHECDFPSKLSHLPTLTAARTTYSGSPGSSAEIDRQVREALGPGDSRGAEDPAPSLYSLDTGMLEALQPDIILTQNLCDVCSIALPEVQAAAQRIGEKSGTEPTIISLDPHTLEQVYDDCLTIGKAIGNEDHAMHQVAALRERFYAAADMVPSFAHAPVVGFLEWTDPIFIAGHWTVQLIERAGGRHPLNETIAKQGSGAAAGAMHSERTAGKSISVPNEIFAATKPEALVIAPCGLTLEQTRHATSEIARQDWFRSLPAVQNGKVALVDGNQYFNRPGPRLVDAFEWLVAWLHEREDRMPVGFGWEQWTN